MNLKHRIVGGRQFIDHLLQVAAERWQIDVRYFLWGGSWLFLPTLLSYFLGILRSVAFARLTEVEFFGQYSFILSVVGLVSILSLPGINTALVETVARGNNGSLLDAARIRFFWGFWVTIVVTGVALYYALIQDERELAIAFIAAGSFVPFTTATGTATYFYNGQKRFDIISHFNSISVISKTTVLLLVLWLQSGLIWLVLADSSVQLLINAWYYRMAVAELDNEQRDSGLASYGRSLTWAGAISTISMQLDGVLLGIFVGFVDVAVLRIATVLPTMSKNLLRILSALLMPKIAGKPDKRVYSKSTRHRLIILAFINIIGVAVVIWLTPSFIYALYGNRYEASVLFAQLLMLSLAFGLPSTFFGSVLQARKETNAIYRASILYSALQLGTLIVTVPFWGIIGIVLSRIAARWGIVLYQWRLVTKL